MRNPLKKFLGKSDSQSSETKLNDELYGELKKIWPDGTWKMLDQRNSKDMDIVARHLLLKTNDLEGYENDSKHWVRMLNPGFFSQPRGVKAGWTPSTKTLNTLFLKEDMDPAIMHYMLAELKNLGKLRP